MVDRSHVNRFVVLKTHQLVRYCYISPSRLVMRSSRRRSVFTWQSWRVFFVTRVRNFVSMRVTCLFVNIYSFIPYGKKNYEFNYKKNDNNNTEENKICLSKTCFYRNLLDFGRGLVKVLCWSNSLLYKYFISWMNVVSCRQSTNSSSATMPH